MFNVVGTFMYKENILILHQAYKMPQCEKPLSLIFQEICNDKFDWYV